MSPPTLSPIIPSTTTTITAPFPPKSPPPLHPSSPSLHNTIAISRRSAAVLVSVITAAAPLVLSLHHPPKASAAFTLGISGPKNWLKEQKKKSSKFLLAPVDASRNILRSAYLLLSRDETEYKEDLEEVKNLVTSAARDCVAQERNSFVAFQAKTGVEVCTFRLIVKNASSLLDDKDPVKLEAEAKLTDLIRSLTSLTDMTNDINTEVASNRLAVANALMDALNSLDNFEQGIKDCLEI